MLAKKYTNPSSDIIEVLAGLDNVDAVFAELVATLDQVIKDGRTSKFLALSDVCYRCAYTSCYSRATTKSRANRNRRSLWWIPNRPRFVLHQSRLLPGAHEGMKLT